MIKLDVLNGVLLVMLDDIALAARTSPASTTQPDTVGSGLVALSPATVNAAQHGGCKLCGLDKPAFPSPYKEQPPLGAMLHGD